ncbi:hypothetical protein CMQ_7843 [Grosmannia clavigera kw1407]|uniref:Uncharacterized protein n=1 Tax=Grosmannia clavigera (strain kw1407 / UAMH 11150) TaxID=655863 RepID=F0XS20_GROCL|nr:uncharacterized protein CMQ_7843 [Grosmannia clavigera kw1407]EFW99475.1 hypothetical protein CMQ_7843 [Grosmannia clavigera kw1407]
MAASVPWVPFPLGHQVPVTPPPDIQAFPPQQPPPLSPHLLKHFAQELYGNSAQGNQKTAAFQAHLMMNQLSSQGGILSGALGSVPSPPPWIKLEADGGMTRAPASARSNSEPTTTSASTAATQTTAGGADSTSTAATTTVHSDAAVQSAKVAEHQTADASAAASANDPRYLAMASRIAAYYHQRCQAVANFQQQRCQAWANMQRQKSQEMTQAAMLVIAWYIRDRIQRRRRRQKRQFRRGLASKARAPTPVKGDGAGADAGAGVGARNRAAGGISGTGRITKGDVVRKWILQVPEGKEAAGSVNSTNRRERLADPEEAAFDIDREVASDKDVRLYNVADNLIKSQLARIDVPMMGKLSFDASESESEEDDDDDEFEEDEDDNEDDYAMVDYEERGAGPAAIAVATMGAAVAARAGLGAGARGQDEGILQAKAKNENDHHNDHDDEYLLEDAEKDSDANLSAMVHHATSHPREKESYYS